MLKIPNFSNFFTIFFFDFLTREVSLNWINFEQMDIVESTCSPFLFLLPSVLMFTQENIQKDWPPKARVCVIESSLGADDAEVWPYDWLIDYTEWRPLGGASVSVVKGSLVEEHRSSGHLCPTWADQMYQFREAQMMFIFGTVWIDWTRMWSFKLNNVRWLMLTQSDGWI